MAKCIESASLLTLDLAGGTVGGIEDWTLPGHVEVAFGAHDDSSPVE